MDRIDDVERELNETTERARRLVQSAEPRLFTVRPHPSSWSAAECISHLTLSTQSFLPVLSEVIDVARARGITTKAKPSMDWMGSVLKWFLEPPVRTRVKTTARFVPRSVRAKGEALAEFSALQMKLIESLHAARDLPLSKIKMVSPFDKRIRYNVYSAFRILAAHQRRHLWQAEQAVDALRTRMAAAS